MEVRLTDLMVDGANRKVCPSRVRRAGSSLPPRVCINERFSPWWWLFATWSCSYPNGWAVCPLMWIEIHKMGKWPLFCGDKETTPTWITVWGGPNLEKVLPFLDRSGWGMSWKSIEMNAWALPRIHQSWPGESPYTHTDLMLYFQHIRMLLLCSACCYLGDLSAKGPTL